MTQTDEPFQRLSSEEAKAIYDAKQSVWIDVREAGEIERGGRIPGATVLPLNRLLAAPAEHLQASSIVFYCAQGIRSAVACEVAAAVGVEQVYNLEGGILDWESKGYPVEK